MNFEKIKNTILVKKNISIGILISLSVITGAVLFYRNHVSPGAADNNLFTSTQNAVVPASVIISPLPSPTPKPDFKNLKAKGLYLTGWTVGDMKKVEKFVKIANETEINTFVVDIKDDDGFVGYESDVASVREAKAWRHKYKVAPVIKAFHDNSIYVIGRVTCFKDPVLAKARPELAIQSTHGSSWRDKDGRPWLDPYNKDCWKYLIDIAKEGINKGFDEIQFDYVRFANDGDTRAMDFSKYNGKQKFEAINEFLDYAKKEIPDNKISADVFGIICESPGDTEKIGQNLDSVGKNIDYLSPMVYPSHYAVGQIVNKVPFPKPDMDPYGVVYNTMLKAKTRIAQIPDYKAKMRPYIQNFTAPWLGKGYYQSYKEVQVREQIKGIYDAGYEEWLVWEATNNYSLDAFEKETPVVKQ